jgi:hypothetical protein
MDKQKPPILSIINSAKRVNGKKPKTLGSGSGGGYKSSNALNFGDYFIYEGAFWQKKKTADDGLAEFPLCNFTCKIVEEITNDDGLADSSFLRIEGRRSDNVPLPMQDVPAKSFYSSLGNWPNEHWGTTPFIYPGAAKKDNLRAAVHLFSTLNADVPRRVIYSYTGWKKINDAWHYLTGSGAITNKGLIEGVEVDLGGGHMSRYQIPAPLAGDELKQAVADSALLMEVCPNKQHIGSVLFSAMARAPLGECYPTDFVLFLHGLTGSKKSELAALVLGFYGDFTARTLPSNFSDTDNAIEVKTFQSKDAIHVVDDFKPATSQTEAAKTHAKAERLIRNTGNQQGRGRLTADSRAKPAPYNRSLAIITGEDLPRGQSLLGRALVLEIGRADVDVKVLTRMQQARDMGRLSGLMAAYLQWLAPNMDQHKKDFPKRVHQCRNSAIQEGFASSHPRAPEIYANLVIGSEIFIDFLQDAGSITLEQANVLSSEVETGLQQSFTEQAAYQIEQDEVERFMQLLRAAFSSGSCHIANRFDQGPPASRPYAWGWRNAGVDMAGDKNYNPMGDCIGYYCDAAGAAPAEVWLIQENAFKIAAQFARNQGDSLLLSAPSLWRRMSERGLIVKMEPARSGNGCKPKLTVKRTVAGRSMRIMVLSADFVESGEKI